MSYKVRIALPSDAPHAVVIKEWYKESSKERGTGIATRTEAYLLEKINKGDAVIALIGEEVIGFCYIETFENKKYVSNSGLIVKKEFRGKGLAYRIKERVFLLARNKYPDARIFGITTSDTVMSINMKLGYRPVAFYNLTNDDAFWDGCSSCPNHDILMNNNKKMCLCTGMLAPSKNEIEKSEPSKQKTNEK